MSACCTLGVPAAPPPTSIGLPSDRRHTCLSGIAALMQWAIPTVTLALIPKCPFCLAAHVALWTGLGLSFTAAFYVRWALIILSILSLTYLAATRVHRRLLRTIP